MSDKLRIMHLMGAGKPGGAETFFMRLMEALHRHRGVEILPVVRTGSWAAARLEELGIPFKTVPFSGWFDWTSGRAVKALAEDFQPHIVQSWMNRATRFMPEGNWRRVARLGGYYKLKYYMKNVDYLIANTSDIKRYCVEGGWPESKVAVLENFIPQPREGWQQEGAGVRARHGIPAHAKVLFMAGRLHAVKGVDVALRALAMLPAHVWLLLAGEGKERGALATLAYELGVSERVVWAGWADDISPLAAAADVWVAPSRVEPLGNTVLDAWAHEVPVVASRTVGPMSLIEDGKSGLLVPVDDASALVAAVEKLLQDAKLRGKVVAGGRKVFDARFSEKVVVEAYVDYYRALTGKGQT